MKRSFSQPSTSGESGKRSRLFSLQQALDLVYDSDEDEQDLADIYPESDLESVDSDVNSESSNEDEGLDVDLDLDLSSPAPRPSTAQVGRGTGRNRSRPTAGGDADNLSTGSTRAFVQQNLRVEFDSRGIGPQNCPPNITEMSSPLEFLSLFLDDDFWETLVTETNRRAAQVKEEKENSYYAKKFQPTTIEELEAFVGLRIFMEYSLIKPTYASYWCSDGKNFVTETPGFREVMERDRFLAIWTFLHIVNERNAELNKEDKIYKIRPFLDSLLEKSRQYYKPRKFFSLDEGMIPSKNRLSIKQYIKANLQNGE